MRPASRFCGRDIEKLAVEKLNTYIVCGMEKNAPSENVKVRLN